MKQKQNKGGIIKGLAFPIGYVTFMNVGQTILSVFLVLMVLFRCLIAALTASNAFGDSMDRFMEWYNYDNAATSIKYALFFSALTTIGALVILWLVFNRKNKSFAEYFRFTKAPAKSIFAAILLGLSLHFIVNAIMMVTESLTTELLELLFRALESIDPAIAEELRVFYRSYLEMMNAMSSDVGMFTIAAIFGAPLIEELVFRAGPLVNFKGKMPTWLALLLTSLLFGLAHGNPIQIAYTFVVGLVLGALFIKTDSIYPCIIGHFCFNAANLIPMIMDGFLGGPYRNETMIEWLDTGYVIYTILAVIIAIPMLVVGLILLFTLRKPAMQDDKPSEPSEPNELITAIQEETQDVSVVIEAEQEQTAEKEPDPV